MFILGISSHYHDAAACLIQDEHIIAAAQEERFTRKKHDASFPRQAIRFCLEQAGIGLDEVSYIGFYDKPFLKFERLCETQMVYAPSGFNAFATALPVWLKEKLFLKKHLSDCFVELQKDMRPGALPDAGTVRAFRENIAQKLCFGEHHQSHAASCFYPSPFDEAAILTMDGVGEWATTSIAHGQGNAITFLKEIHFPHSLGLLYSAFTYYLGFKVNAGEYKVMGLAPYGEPRYVSLIRDHLIDVKSDGSFRMNMAYFNYPAGLTMTNRKFETLFGQPVRRAESELLPFHMDMARSLQDVTEDIMLKLAATAKSLTGSRHLVMAGGVALNCVGNGRIVREKLFDRVWIQPAAGDAGGALGVAQSLYYQELGHPRSVVFSDRMQGACLGKQFSNEDVQRSLEEFRAVYRRAQDVPALCAEVSELLACGKVVGWLQGRMEFGPRALGARSILGDPRDPKMQSRMNLKIKFRESFRPFAPAVLREHADDYFMLDEESPYMLLTAPLQPAQRREAAQEQALSGLARLNAPCSTIPAVTHVDGSARVQTVDAHTHPKFHALLTAFRERTGCAVLINTSFNVRGEPPVCSPQDAYRCFMRSGIDALVMEDYILLKEDQPSWQEAPDWEQEFVLD